MADIDDIRLVFARRLFTGMAHSKFKAEVYILKKEEGGRHTPFHNKYRPQFYLRTMDCTGEITLPEGTEMVMPGDNVTITVELIYPVALNPGCLLYTSRCV